VNDKGQGTDMKLIRAMRTEVRTRGAGFEYVRRRSRWEHPEIRAARGRRGQGRIVMETEIGMISGEVVLNQRTD